MLQSEFQGFQGVAVSGLGSRSLDSSPLYGLNVSLKIFEREVSLAWANLEA